MARQLPPRDPYFGGLRVALGQVDEGLVIRADGNVAVDSTGNGDGATRARKLNPIDVLAAALFHDRVSALRVGTPGVRPDRERPPRRDFAGRCTFRPSVTPPHDHEAQPIRLKPRALHREVREPFAVG